MKRESEGLKMDDKQGSESGWRLKEQEKVAVQDRLSQIGA